MFKRKSKRKPKGAPKRKPATVKPATSAPTPTGRGIVVPRRRMNIDTVLLGIALLAITVGCTLLLLEIFQYGGFGAIKGPA